MSETITITGEVAAKRKKGENIKVAYLGKDESGAIKEFGIAPDDVFGIRVTTTDGAVTEDITFSDLPSNVQLQALAFGMNTVCRNQYNTRLAGADGDKDDAAVSLMERIAGFRSGSWRSTGEGEGAEPLVFQGLLRAYADAGQAEVGKQKYDEYSAAYAAADKAQKALIRAKLEKNDKVKEATLTIQSERTAEKLAKYKALKAAEGATGDAFAGL
jgi:hypothetical protein